MAVTQERVRIATVDPDTGAKQVAKIVPDHLRQRRRRGTGRDYVSDQGYRVVTVPGHPLADKSGRVYEHRLVLFEAIGNGPHTCHWCGRNVTWKRAKGASLLAVDHLNDSRIDNGPENLVPSCVRCNSERARRPDFLTHCENGHEWRPETTYIRPDGKGRRCVSCRQARAARAARAAADERTQACAKQSAAIAEASRLYGPDTPRDIRRRVALELRDVGCTLEAIGSVFGVSRHKVHRDFAATRQQAGAS